MSQRIPSIRAVEKSVPSKIRYLSIKDTTVDINNVRNKLGVCRDYPNGDIPQFVKRENAHGEVSHDFDRFGFEIPIGSNPILPGDVSVRNEDEQVVRTDTDEWEEHYQTLLTRSENLLRIIAKKESGNRAWTSEYREDNKEYHKYNANFARDNLKPFHCRRHNLPRPFKCYIQLSTMNYGEAKTLQRLAYTMKLYEVVKEFNHILFANRPVIQVKVLECRATQVYRIPVGLKIKANELTVKRSEIASIATMLDGDVNKFTVLRGNNAKIWWNHRLVQSAKELITGDSPQFEKSYLMLRTVGNKIIRLYILKRMTTEQQCELIENWMSVKREVGSKLWISFCFRSCSGDVLEIIQTRMEVIRRGERCVRILGEHGTQIEVLSVDDPTFHGSRIEAKIIRN